MRLGGWVLVLLLLATAVEASMPPFDSARAWEHLLAQCAFGPRNPGGQGHRRCAEYLEAVLRKTTDDLSVQGFQALPGAGADSVRLTNLIARYGGPGRPLLLGAHWDTRPWSDEDPDSTKWDLPILGANDGASGTAVLLTLAELMHEEPPPMPVQVALFDGEDGGSDEFPDDWCLGSQAYARRMTPPLPFAVVIIDIVGSKDLHICREEYSETLAGWLNNLVFGRAEALGLAGFENRVCYSVYDDHVPFLKRGLPAVDLVDMHFTSWHTQHDVPQACSRESLGQLGRLLVDLVYGGTLQ